MSISKRLRYEVLRRDNFACRYCGVKAPDAELTVDHVVPRAFGGSDQPENLVAACQDCNIGKSTSTADHPLVLGAAPPDHRQVEAVRQALARWRESQRGYWNNASRLLYHWDIADLTHQQVRVYDSPACDDLGPLIDAIPPTPGDLDELYAQIAGWMRAGVDYDFLFDLMWPIRKSKTIESAHKWERFVHTVTATIKMLRHDAAEFEARQAASRGVAE